MRYLVDAIIHDRRLSDFMRAADVFEQGKVLGEPVVMEIEAECTPSEVLERLVSKLPKEAAVSFIYVDEDNLWWDKNVRVISNGEKWMILEEYIKATYPKLLVETNEFRYITSITKNPEIH